MFIIKFNQRRFSDLRIELLLTPAKIRTITKKNQKDFSILKEKREIFPFRSINKMESFF